MNIRKPLPNHVNLDHLFDDEFVRSLNLKGYMINKKFNRGFPIKRRFVRQVFAEFLKLVILECIENNSRFMSPCFEYFIIYIQKKSDQETKAILNKNNAYPGVDLIKSDGKIYNFVLYSPFLPRGAEYRHVRIGKKYYDKLVQKVNEGKRYEPKQGNYTHRMEDFMFLIKEIFPDLPIEKIKQIIKIGAARMMSNMKKNRQIAFSQRLIKFVVFPKDL